jgi:hypothetical protein
MGVSWGAGQHACVPGKETRIASLASHPLRGLARYFRKLLVGGGAHVRR